MTQAFNLSQLANKVNTSGQLNASTGLSSTVPVANGGTNLSTPGAAGNVLTSNGSAWVSSPASAGFSGATINAASGTALTLTNASTQTQVMQFTSATNSVVNLPSATTLTYEGSPIYVLINRSQANSTVFVYNATGGLLASIPKNQMLSISLLDNATSAGVWSCALEDIDPTPALVETNSITNNLSSTQTYLQGRSSDVYCVALTTSTYAFGQFWLNSDGRSYLRAWACTVSGSTFTFGAPVNSELASVNNYGSSANSYSYYNLQGFALNTTTAIFHGGIFGWVDGGCSGWLVGNYNASFAVTVSGTTVTVGGQNTNSVPATGNTAGIPIFTNEGGWSFGAYHPIRIPISTTHFATIYQDGYSYAAGTWQYRGTGNLRCTITSVSGTTQTVGAAVTLAANLGAPIAAVSHATNSFVLTYYTLTSTGSAGGIRKAATCSVSGTVPTWGTVTNLDLSNVNCTRPIYTQVSAVALSATKAILPTYQVTGAGQINQFRTVTISGAVPTFVSGSQASLPTESPMFAYRSATEWLVFPSAINTAQGNANFFRYAINGSDAIYEKEKLTFETDDKLSSPFYAGMIPQPPTSATAIVLNYSNYSSSAPIGTTNFIQKGTIPS